MITVLDIFENKLEEVLNHDSAQAIQYVLGMMRREDRKNHPRYMRSAMWNLLKKARHETMREILGVRR